MGGHSQRSHEISYGVAGAQLRQPPRGSTHLLDGDADTALFSIPVGKGQRNALTFLIDADDDELPRLRLPRHHGRVYLVQVGVGHEVLSQ